MQAVTTDGRVITVAERPGVGPTRRTAAERLLLDSNLSSSAPAALAFRGLLLVAIVLAAIIAWT